MRYWSAEAVTEPEPGNPRAVQPEFDAVAPAGVFEPGLVLVGDLRRVFGPAPGPGRGQDFDDPCWLVGRIPHGMLDATGLECPFTGPGGVYLVSDQDADLAGFDAKPDVVAG